MRRPPPVCRSRVTRVLFVVTGIFNAILLAPGSSPRWHRAPSLRFLHHVLPWWVMSAACAVYAALMLAHLLTRWVVADRLGCLLGLGIYITAAAAMVITGLLLGQNANPLTFSAVFLAIALHFNAARLAFFDRGWPR